MCFSQAYYGCDETPWPKATWGRKNLFGFHTVCSPTLKEIRAGTQAGQEPGGRSSCRGHGGWCLLACSYCYSVCFLLEPRATRPEMEPPTLGWALRHQLLINKISCLMKAFSQLRFFLSDNSSLSYAHIKLASMKYTLNCRV